MYSVLCLLLLNNAKIFYKKEIYGTQDHNETKISLKRKYMEHNETKISLKRKYMEHNETKKFSKEEIYGTQQNKNFS